MVQQGRTSDPLLGRVMLARRINHFCGTAIGPWDVDDLPDVFIDAINALDSDLTEITSGLEKVRGVQNRIRRQHERKHP
jgi:hypothetical protein